MEKLLSEDERIRKAEEIYYRRKTGNTINLKEEKNEAKKSRPIKKMLDIIIFCLLIYTIFYAIQNKNYIFTQEFISNVDKTFSVDLKQKIGEVVNYINNKYSTNDSEQTAQPATDNEIVPNTTNVDTPAESTQYIEATLAISEDISSFSQMDFDIEQIKSMYEISKPIEGEITSEFGVRSLTNITVSGYHTGLDIAGNTGDKITSAISGTVEEVSDYGAYGKHIRIVNGDLETMYAHCNKIYVNTGDVINIGDEIGEVGSTGNSTGPHLHFEVKIEDRYVDPQYLLNY